ncbi:MAG: PfkB family carbohydrate kinase [Nitratireductor sp.]
MTNCNNACFVTGAHMDIAARLFASPVAGSSNPGKLVLQPGGAGLNAASVAASLGLSSSLAGPVGDDGHGVEIRKAVAARGIQDHLVTISGQPSGTYTAVMAPDGEMVIGIADLALYEMVDAPWFAMHCRAALDAATLWFLSANLDAGALVELAEMAGTAGHRLLAAATVSPAKAVRLRPCLSRLDIIFTNLKEARALVDAPGADAVALARLLIASGTRSGVISQGAGPAIFWENGTTGTISPPRVEKIVDVNGAGDALAGATLAGLAKGRTLAEALPSAIIAAQMTLASPEPFVEGLDLARLDALAAGINASQI